MPNLCASLEEGVGAILLAEEALTANVWAALSAWNPCPTKAAASGWNFRSPKTKHSL
jgi:hypothetical protein